ncbi:unnamed protein product [Leptidea sinapis]|uniref:2Fe-2S ferredoxin-type domain-containing protein n=1 Tax=Leptidea sinapis TaxID=189913 RepID=A0A5E4QFD4_9NEOP|nr:unnamed protein product [Leptidea sinapis]VVC96721.1 unnamed protein product [Leptidea sinapis]
MYDGRRIETEGKVGDSLLDVVVNNDLDIDGYGACEGTVTCSTYLAYGLTDTSRLGCQVTLTKDLDGLVVKVPETVNDARS